jgi:hypothetical protein
MTTAIKLQLAHVFILLAPTVFFLLDYCRPNTGRKKVLKCSMSSSEENANIDQPIAGSFFNEVPSMKA